MPTFAHADFVARALDAFPELAEDFEYDAARPRMQLSAFAQRLQRAKGAADWAAYQRGIQLIAHLWDTADDSLAAGLRSTFMRELDFDGDRGPIAWAYLSAELQRAWSVARKHVDELTTPPRRAKT